MKNKNNYRTLTKPGAKTHIVFIPQKEDDWFVDLNHVDNKTGKIIRNSMIIEKDVEIFISNYKSQGWTLSE
jgi:REP element-mobilizing transposase RayT